MRSGPFPKPAIADVNCVSLHYGETMRNKLALALRMATDADREKRLGALQCSWCFYGFSGRFSGATMTGWACAECAQEQPMHGCTSTPKLCDPCATKLELCSKCCADLDYRPRRRLHRLRKGDRILKGKRAALEKILEKL